MSSWTPDANGKENQNARLQPGLHPRGGVADGGYRFHPLFEALANYSRSRALDSRISTGRIFIRGAAYGYVPLPLRFVSKQIQAGVFAHLTF